MRKVALLFLFLLLFAVPNVVKAGTVEWTLPSLYTDNTAIDAADQATLVTEVQLGISATGPWSALGTSTAGASSLIATTPRNRYYQARCGWPSVNVWSVYCPPFYWSSPPTKAPGALSIKP
jgi:hypothetical protein